MGEFGIVLSSSAQSLPDCTVQSLFAQESTREISEPSIRTEIGLPQEAVSSSEEEGENPAASVETQKASSERNETERYLVGGEKQGRNLKKAMNAMIKSARVWQNAHVRSKARSEKDQQTDILEAFSVDVSTL